MAIDWTQIADEFGYEHDKAPLNLCMALATLREKFAIVEYERNRLLRRIDRVAWAKEMQYLNGLKKRIPELEAALAEAGDRAIKAIQIAQQARRSRFS